MRKDRKEKGRAVAPGTGGHWNDDGAPSRALQPSSTLLRALTTVDLDTVDHQRVTRADLPQRAYSYRPSANRIIPDRPMRSGSK